MSLQDLSILMANFVAKVERGVVLLDGLEYLITNHGFDSVMRFLQLNRSRFEQLNSVLIVPVLEGATEITHLKLMERDENAQDPLQMKSF